MYRFLSISSAACVKRWPVLALAAGVALSGGLLCATDLAADDAPPGISELRERTGYSGETTLYAPPGSTPHLTKPAISPMHDWVTRFTNDTPEGKFDDTVEHKSQMKSEGKHEKSRKKHRKEPMESFTAERLLSMLPSSMTSDQQRVAREMILEATPRLQEMGIAFVEACDELQTLSISRDTPPERLVNLGNELSRSRKELKKELRRLSRDIEKATGVDLKLDDKKSHEKPLARRLRHE